MKKRKDGRYRLKVNAGTDKSGKIKYKYVYADTKKEAQRKADELKTAIGRGLNSDEINSTLFKWIDLFLASEKQRLTPQEYKTKEYRLYIFKNHYNKGTKIADIRAFEIEDILYQLADKNPKTGNKSSKKTITGYKQTISQLFKFAQMNSAIISNPCDMIREISAEKKKTRRALTLTEQNQILNLPDYMFPAKAMAYLGMLAGLRRGEIASLKWEDIDFENKFIRIERSYNYKTNSIKSPKTENGIRIVPLVECLENYLLTIPRKSEYVIGKIPKQYEWEKCQCEIMQYIDKDADEQLKTIRLSDRYNVLLSIKPFGWHELRHTYATMLYDYNVPVKAAQKFLGHAQTSTTMDIYTHLSKEKEIESINLIRQYGGQMGVKQN